MKCAMFGRIAVTALLIATSAWRRQRGGHAGQSAESAAAAGVRLERLLYRRLCGCRVDGPGKYERIRALLTALAACLAAGSGTYNGVQTTAYDMRSSFVGGGTVGDNWQPTPYTLIGLENNYGYLNLKGSITQNPPPIGNGDTTAFAKLGDWYDALTVRHRCGRRSCDVLRERRRRGGARADRRGR